MAPRSDERVAASAGDARHGFAVLAFDGDGPPPEELTEETRLMRELVTFRP
jgi:hypothetical protein